MGKAPNGSGSIWRRKDGRYGAALTHDYYDPATGRAKRKTSSTTKSTWDSAHRWLVGQQSDLLGGAVRPSDSAAAQTLGEFLSEWLRDVVEPQVAPKTYEKREYHVRVHLLPALGHVRLKELQPRQVHALYTRMARRDSPLAASTRRDVHTTLKMALKQAVRWGLIPSNPVDLVDPPRLAPKDDEEDEDGEIRALTDDQAVRLFEATKGSRWRNYYVIAIRAGLRPGEMLGLRWGDVALGVEPASLRVRRTLGIKKGGGTYTKRPKSEAGKRTVALHWEAADALLAQRMMLEDEGLSRGPKDLVFPNTLGRPMSRHNLLNRHLRPDLAAAGLPSLTLHELRHTFASIALHEWRLYPDIVREMMGHSSLGMTTKLYGHLMESAQADAIRALRRMHHKPDEAASQP